MSEVTTTTTETTTTTTRRIFTAQELSRCRKLLAEESAVLVSLERGTWRRRVPPPEGSAEGTPATFQDASWVRLVRKWPRIAEGDRALCEEFLARFASAMNATVAPPAGQPADCDTVEDPRTDREKFPGVWRMRRTALTPLRTDPAQQGVYQTLVWPAEFEGEVGGYCSESSPLHHEDATVYSNAAEPPDAEHENVPGHIYRVNGSIDTETGLWSGQKTDDIARTPPLYGTWSTRADAVTLRVRGEHAAAPFFPLLSGTSAAAIKALADDFISATADTDEAKAAALASAVALCDHPAMTSTADMDPYGLFSVSAEITFPVATLLVVLRRQKRFVEVVATFANAAAEPTWAQAVAALPQEDAAFVSALPLREYRLAEGGAPRHNEFGLLDGTISWRIPVAADSGDGLYGTWSRSAERVTLRVRGEHGTAPFFPLSGGTTDAAILALSAPFRTSFPGKVPVLAHPILVTNADMDQYGLFSVTAEIAWPIPSLVAVVAPMKRHSDVEVEFSSQATLPTFAALCAEGGPLHGHSVADEPLKAYAIVPSIAVRVDEFGLLDGHITWRIPKEWHTGWVRVGFDADDPVWRKWGWNQVADTTTPPGVLPGTSTGTLRVTTSPVASVWTATQTNAAQGETPYVVTTSSGNAVIVPAGTYRVDFPVVAGQTTPAAITGIVVAEGATVERSATRSYLSGTIDNPIPALAVDMAEGTITLTQTTERPFSDWADGEYRLFHDTVEDEWHVAIAPDSQQPNEWTVAADVIEADSVNISDNTVTVGGVETDAGDFDPWTVFICDGETWFTNEDGEISAPDEVVEVLGVNYQQHVVTVYFSGEWLDICSVGYYYGIVAGQPDAGKLYLCDLDFVLSEVDPYAPREASGGEQDPIRVAAVSAAQGKVKLYETDEDTGEEVPSDSWTTAIDGLYYVLWEGEDAGTLYVAANGTLSPVTADEHAMDVSVGTDTDVGPLPASIFVVGSDGVWTMDMGGTFSSDAYIFTKDLSLDWNEYGLVDYSISVHGEKNPYWGPNGNGLTWKSQSGEAKYHFIRNHQNSTASSNEGFVYLVYTTTVSSLRAYKTEAAAIAECNRIIGASPNSHHTTAQIQRHGKWWVVASDDTSHHSANNVSA